MKRMIVSGILGVLVNCANAQGIGSFFTQQDSKDKLMLEQILLQQTYLSEIKSGYKATENGLNTAHNLKNGTYSLHQGHFNSLIQVSPAVRNNPRIPLIVQYQQEIMTGFENEITWQSREAILAGDEMGYLQKVYNNILAQCSRDLDELKLAIDPGTQMKDEERIKRIDLIYAATDDKYSFSRSFLQTVRAFALGRQSGREQMQLIRKLYDLN